MTAPDDRRQDLTDRMADFLLANGTSAATLRPLAAAAGVSDRMLLYYFKDKQQALAAAFDCVQHRFAGTLDARRQDRLLPMGRLRGRVIPMLLADDLWPYLQLWLDISAQAARGDPVQRDRGRAIWQVCLAWVQSQLISNGPNEAARLLRMIQAAMLQKAIGLDDTAAD